MKKFLTTLVTSVVLTTTFVGVTGQKEQPRTVQAASKFCVTVKGRRKVRLYSSRGRRLRSFAYPKRKYLYYGQKKIRLGRHYQKAYRLSGGRYLLSKNASVVKNKKKAKPLYRQAKLTLPAGYTRSALLNAYRGHPSSAFVAASMKGMQQNQFKNSESAKDNRTKIKPGHLTASQSKELAAFSLRLINEVRRQLNLPSWQYSAGTQKLAADIAREYTVHHRSIRDGRHYVAGIVRACHASGLNLNDNYVEDMAGLASKNKTLTMTQMKSDVYFGLKQMIFGYAGSSERGNKQRSLYREWEHAGDFFNTQGSPHDGDYNYYGFSVSQTGHLISMHYISVPHFVVTSSVYNNHFRP